MIKYDYDVIIDGYSMNARGIRAIKRPDAAAAQKRYKSYALPNRDGTFYKDTGYLEDITKTVSFNFIEWDENKWNARAREIQRVLSNAKIIQFSDDQGGYYKIKKVEIGTIKRASLNHIGTFDVDFILEPYFYHDNKITKDNVLRNPYEICKPIYYIEKAGDSTSGILTINHSNIPFTIAEDVTIDTELQLIYTTKGHKNAMTGFNVDFEELWLAPGVNTTSISQGFILTVKADWREIG